MIRAENLISLETPFPLNIDQIAASKLHQLCYGVKFQFNTLHRLTIIQIRPEVLVENTSIEPTRRRRTD